MSAKSKGNDLPKLCICKKHQPGTFDHYLGFVIGILTQVVATTVALVGLYNYLFQGEAEGLLFSIAWVCFDLAYYLVNLISRRRHGHEMFCAKRYALTSLIFIRR